VLFFFCTVLSWNRSGYPSNCIRVPTSQNG